MGEPDDDTLRKPAAKLYNRLYLIVRQVVPMDTRDDYRIAGKPPGEFLGERLDQQVLFVTEKGEGRGTGRRITVFPRSSWNGWASCSTGPP